MPVEKLSLKLEIDPSFQHIKQQRLLTVLNSGKNSQLRKLHLATFIMLDAATNINDLLGSLREKASLSQPCEDIIG